jgi:hypothetical protein
MMKGAGKRPATIIECLKKMINQNENIAGERLRTPAIHAAR